MERKNARQIKERKINQCKGEKTSSRKLKYLK
jgi:hypothetical protein